MSNINQLVEQYLIEAVNIKGVKVKFPPEGSIGKTQNLEGIQKVQKSNKSFIDSASPELQQKIKDEEKINDRYFQATELNQTESDAKIRADLEKKPYTSTLEEIKNKSKKNQPEIQPGDLGEALRKPNVDAQKKPSEIPEKLEMEKDVLHPHSKAENLSPDSRTDAQLQELVKKNATDNAIAAAKEDLKSSKVKNFSDETKPITKETPSASGAKLGKTTATAIALGVPAAVGLGALTLGGNNSETPSAKAAIKQQVDSGLSTVAKKQTPSSGGGSSSAPSSKTTPSSKSVYSSDDSSDNTSSNSQSYSPALSKAISASNQYGSGNSSSSKSSNMPSTDEIVKTRLDKLDNKPEDLVKDYGKGHYGVYSKEFGDKNIPEAMNIAMTKNFNAVQSGERENYK